MPTFSCIFFQYFSYTQVFFTQLWSSIFLCTASFPPNIITFPYDKFSRSSTFKGYMNSFRSPHKQQKLALIWYSLCARPCAKCFLCTCSLINTKIFRLSAIDIHYRGEEPSQKSWVWNLLSQSSYPLNPTAIPHKN